MFKVHTGFTARIKENRRGFDTKKERVIQKKEKVFEMLTGKIISRMKPDTKGKLVQQGFSTVRSHVRHMKMPARPFLSTTLNDREEDYSRAISEAILQAWESDTP